MQKVFCDRCGKECESTTHYLIRIYAEDNNLQLNIKSVMNSEQQYCIQCKDEFEKFLTSKPTEVISKTNKNDKVSLFLKRWLR